jgi:hypothetical protein
LEDDAMTARTTIILLAIMSIASCAGMLWSLFDRPEDAKPLLGYTQCMLSWDYNRSMTIEHLAVLQTHCKEENEKATGK